MAARRPARRAIASEIAAIARHHPGGDPRLPQLRQHGQALRAAEELTDWAQRGCAGAVRPPARPPRSAAWPPSSTPASPARAAAAMPPDSKERCPRPGSSAPHDVTIGGGNVVFTVAQAGPAAVPELPAAWLRRRGIHADWTVGA
ncbi:MAG TPA: hypothetical protein VMV07_08505 [Streptosporangiaceae bacterium]|nr:hypothetical protein [Streptosporangiaceae bacterium]